MENKKKSKAVFIVIPVLVGILIVGVVFFLNGKNHITCDNAQLDGVILSIRTSVTGTVKEVRFADNQMVKKGDTLVIIDIKDLELRATEAEAVMENAEAALQAARISAQAAGNSASSQTFSSEVSKESIEQARIHFAQAENDYKRAKNLQKADAISGHQFDLSKEQYDQAKAALEIAQSHYAATLEQAGGARHQAKAQTMQIAAAEASLKQKKASYELVKSQLEDCYIKAPYDGIISKKSVEPGQFVQTGQPLCSAIEIKDLWVTANFKETQVSKIKIGNDVKIAVDAYPDMELKGKIESFEGATGARFSLLPPDNATGNFVKVTQRIPVRIKLNETANKSGVLSPGMSVEVDVITK